MAPLGIIHVLLRTYQVLCAILIIVLVALLLHGVRGGLANTTAGVALDLAAAAAAVALVASTIVAALRCAAAPRRLLPVVMSLDGFMTALSFASAVVLTYGLGFRDCGRIGIPDLKSACCAMQATIVCMWIMFTCFVVTTFLSFKEYRNSKVGEGPSKE